MIEKITQYRIICDKCKNCYIVYNSLKNINQVKKELRKIGYIITRDNKIICVKCKKEK